MRIASKQAPRNLALINNLNERAAERKVICVLVLSLVTDRRKGVTDKFQEMRVTNVTLRELQQIVMKHLANCETEIWKDSSFFKKAETK